MDLSHAIERKARRAAEEAARSALMQATQMLRQFHRIGKGRSAGCRGGLLKLLGEHLRDLRRQLVNTVVEVSGGETDIDRATTLISGALATTTDRFAAELQELLQAMDGASASDLDTLCGAETDEIRAALEEALFDLDRVSPAPELGFVTDDRLRRQAATLAAEAARPDDHAAAVMAAAALAAVLQDALAPSPTPHRPCDLLASATTRGLVPRFLADDGEWLTRRRHLLDPQALLRRAEPVCREDAAALLGLLSAVCAHLSQGG